MVAAAEQLTNQLVQDQASRVDGWANLVAGLGVIGRDKREHTFFAVDRTLGRQTIDSIYRGDAIGARIVETAARDMVRAWFTINVAPVDDEKAPITPAEASAMASGVQDKLDDIRARKEIGRALRWARLYGGSIIVVGLKDGQDDLAEPVNPDAIQDVIWLKALTRYQVNPGQNVDDFESEFFGRPELYEVLPFTKDGQARMVHASRILRFDGVDFPDDANLRSHDARWGDSVLFRAYNSLRDYHSGYQGAATLIHDFAQAVWGIPHLHDLISSGREDLIQSRIGIQDFVRSVTNAVMLDTSIGETFERKATPVTGLSDLLDRLSVKLSAASGMPMTLLYGTAPKGFATEDKSGQENWDDVISSMQTEDLQPELERLIGYVFAAKDGPSEGRTPETWSIDFAALTQATEAERATVRQTMANADGVYLDRGVVSPDEVAASRFASDGYSIETILDVEGRAEFEQTEGDLSPPEPEPPAPEPEAPEPAEEPPEEPGAEEA